MTACWRRRTLAPISNRRVAGAAATDRAPAGVLWPWLESGEPRLLCQGAEGRSWNVRGAGFEPVFRQSGLPVVPSLLDDCRESWNARMGRNGRSCAAAAHAAAVAAVPRVYSAAVPSALFQLLPAPSCSLPRPSESQSLSAARPMCFTGSHKPCSSTRSLPQIRPADSRMARPCTTVAEGAALASRARQLGSRKAAASAPPSMPEAMPNSSGSVAGALTTSL